LRSDIFLKLWERSKLTRSLPSDSIAPSTFLLCVDFWGFCCLPYSRRA
jgi:hypothetical protein